MRRYVKQIRLRIGCIIVFLAVMIFFMVLSGELGWGDSRYMTSLMRTYSGLAFFGCLVYLIVYLVRYRKLLHNRELMEESRILEQDEREQMIHDKSGGILVDLGIPVELATTGDNVQEVKKRAVLSKVQNKHKGK